MEELLDRGVLGRAREYLGFSPVLVVQGARQTGKSTLARMLAPDGSRSLTLDDSGALDAAREDRAASWSRRVMVCSSLMRCSAFLN